MKKRIVSGIMLSLLFVGMLTFAFNIQPVKAWTGTVYVRADGSIDPPDAPIQRDGNVYTLTGNITSDANGIVVERDGIVVDGAGYTVQGAGSGTGIDIERRSNVIIKHIKIKTFATGIDLDYSSSIFIFRNVMKNNTVGIGLYESSNNIISVNNITQKHARSRACAISLHDSSYNIISVNNITYNYDGIRLYADSSNNTISGNNVAYNDGGVRLRSVYEAEPSNNSIHHNNFIDNSEQVVETSGTNFWDDGYPSGGNYWSDYMGVDEKSGAGQDQPGSDGIGDAPYVLGSQNRDNYPLMNLSVSSPLKHELATSIGAPTSHMQLGTPVVLNATVTNQGSSGETNVELLLFIDGIIADSKTIPFLQSGDLYTLSYLWIPTVKGTYNITAYVQLIPGEAFIENNQDTKFITVWPVGVKVGDWIKYEYTYTNAPSGTALPQWLKVEFLSVEGTSVTLRLTIHMSNGTVDSETLNLDIARTLPYETGGAIDTYFGFGFIIPANVTVGDSVHVMLLSPKFMLSSEIDGEDTRTYAGVSKNIVHATFILIGGRYGSTPLKYYWDKQTGVLVEASATINGMTVSSKATETNMWQAALPAAPPTFWMQWWLWATVAAAIVALAGAVYLLKKRKPPTPTAPTEST